MCVWHICLWVMYSISRPFTGQSRHPFFTALSLLLPPERPKSIFQRDTFREICETQNAYICTYVHYATGNCDCFLFYSFFVVCMIMTPTLTIYTNTPSERRISTWIVGIISEIDRTEKRCEEECFSFHAWTWAIEAKCSNEARRVSDSRWVRRYKRSSEVLIEDGWMNGNKNSSICMTRHFNNLC